MCDVPGQSAEQGRQYEAQKDADCTCEYDDTDRHIASVSTPRSLSTDHGSARDAPTAGSGV